MKKIISFAIAGILLIALVTAGIISINKNLTLTPEQKTALAELSLDNYNVIDYSLGADEVERCLQKERCWEEMYEMFNETLNKTVNVSVEVCESAINSCNKFLTFWNNCSKYEVIETEECSLWGNQTCLEYMNETLKEICIEYSEGLCIENTTIQSQGDCLIWEKIYYTEQEIVDILNNWEEERMVLIAGATISRADRNKTIVREGVTTIQ